MRSHSVTCHTAEVTFPRLPQPKLVLDLATLEGCKAELTWDTMVFGRGRERSTSSDIVKIFAVINRHCRHLYDRRLLISVNTSLVSQHDLEPNPLGSRHPLVAWS